MDKNKPLPFPDVHIAVGPEAIDEVLETSGALITELNMPPAKTALTMNENNRLDKNRLTQKGDGHDWRDLTNEEIKKANGIDHRSDLPELLPDNFKKRYCERCGSYAPDFLDYKKIPFTCNLALVNNIHEE